MKLDGSVGCQIFFRDLSLYISNFYEVIGNLCQIVGGDRGYVWTNMDILCYLYASRRSKYAIQTSRKNITHY